MHKSSNFRNIRTSRIIFPKSEYFSRDIFLVFPLFQHLFANAAGMEFFLVIFGENFTLQIGNVSGSPESYDLGWFFLILGANFKLSNQQCPPELGKIPGELPNSCQDFTSRKSEFVQILPGFSEFFQFRVWEFSNFREVPSLREITVI